MSVEPAFALCPGGQIVMGVAADMTEPEWADLSIRSDGVAFYCDPAGDDSNDGLSPATAVATPQYAHDNLLRDGHADQLLCKAGASWPNHTVLQLTKGGESAAAPMVFSIYGSGSRPYFPDGHVFVQASLRSHVVFHGWELEGVNGESMDDAGFEVTGFGGGLLLEDMKVHRYATNLIIQDAATPITGVVVRAGAYVDACYWNVGAGNGIYCFNLVGAVFEHVITDHNGWKDVADQSIFNHNYYLYPQNADGGDTDYLMRYCISARASATGVAMYGGGTVYRNLFYRNPLSIGVGGGGAGGLGASVEQNVIVDGENINSGGEDQPRGIAFSFGGVNVAGPFVHRDNIVCNNEHGTGPVGFKFGTSMGDMTIDENIVYDYGPAVTIGSAPVGAVAFTLNGFKSAANPVLLSDAAIPVGVTFAGDLYYSDVGGSLFDVNGSGVDAAGWPGVSGEMDASFVSPDYPNPGRTLGDYDASIGGDGTEEHFLTVRAQMTKANWDARYSAARAIDYFRLNFGKAALT